LISGRLHWNAPGQSNASRVAIIGDQARTLQCCPRQLSVEALTVRFVIDTNYPGCSNQQARYWFEVGIVTAGALLADAMSKSQQEGGFP
jgi:hypothetical protein